MQCSCGGTTDYMIHEVKTLSKAKEWYPGIEIEEDILPIEVRRDVCLSCGRQLVHPFRHWRKQVIHRNNNQLKG